MLQPAFLVSAGIRRGPWLTKRLGGPGVGHGLCRPWWLMPVLKTCLAIGVLAVFVQRSPLLGKLPEPRSGFYIARFLSKLRWQVRLRPPLAARGLMYHVSGPVSLALVAPKVSRTLGMDPFCASFASKSIASLGPCWLPGLAQSERFCTQLLQSFLRTMMATLLADASLSACMVSRWTR